MILEILKLQLIKKVEENSRIYLTSEIKITFQFNILVEGEIVQILLELVSIYCSSFFSITSQCTVF